MKAKRITKKTLSTLAVCLGMTMDDLLSHCRKAELVDARSMIVAVLIEYTHLRQQDVAPMLDISQAAVSKLYARHRLLMKSLGGDPDYQQRFADFVKMSALTPCPLSPRRGGREATKRLCVQQAPLSTMERGRG